jgi:hypothetical protein
MPDTPPGGAPCRSPVRLPGSPVSHPPYTEADERGFVLALANLASLPYPERLALAAFISYWLQLTRERRAGLAKAANPELTDAEIARLVGRDPRSLRRWAGYQRLKSQMKGRPRASRQPDFCDAVEAEA